MSKLITLAITIVSLMLLSAPHGFCAVNMTAIREDTLHLQVIMDGDSVAGTDTLTGTVYVDVTNSDYHGAYIVCSGSAPSVKVYVENTYDKSDVASFKVPNNDDAGLVATITGAGVSNGFNNILQLSYMKWMRFVVVGQAGNGADTTIDIVLCRDTKQK